MLIVWKEYVSFCQELTNWLPKWPHRSAFPAVGDGSRVSTASPASSFGSILGFAHPHRCVVVVFYVYFYFYSFVHSFFSGSILAFNVV